MPEPLASRELTEPALSRLPLDQPARAAILKAHAEALAAGAAGYVDPDSGLFVLTAGYLAARGTCCSRGCRHCPFVSDLSAPLHATTRATARSGSDKSVVDRCRLKVMATRTAADLEVQATALLRSAGQRVTKPRVALLARIIGASGSHLSADVLHEQVAGVDPAIHRATVYRTLEGLTAAGLLRHVHLDRGLTAYHLADGVTVAAAHHHEGQHLHAQCSQCGQVTDLPADVLGDTGDRIRRASGFRLDATHVALSGRCASCVAADEQ